MTSLKEVIIISKDRILRGIPDGLCRGNVCYYLCDDYSVYSVIKKKYADDLDIHLLGQEFHRVIEEIAGQFLSFSHRINKRNESYAFWGTHLASRSSGTIPLFKHIVYFHCAKKILDHAEGRTIFICDSLALTKLIQEYINERGGRCQIYLAHMERLKTVFVYLLLAVKGCYFLISSILLFIYSRLLDNRRIAKETLRERYVLRSWVTAGSVDKDGHYRDRNFGVLPAFLSEQGKDVWTIPLYFNLDQNMFAQMKLMSKSGHQFIFPEQYLSLLDILKTLCDGVRGIVLDLNSCEFEGQDIRCLVREMHLPRSMQPSSLSFNSVKYLLEKFEKRNIRIDRIIYPIENNPPEKPFLLAIRQHYPQSKIIGFQHTVWLKEQLGVFLLPEELLYHPLPDRIICSGRQYPNILKITGFPPGMLTPGPNLRYTAVNENLKVNQPDETSGIRKILIIFNYEINHVLELLEKTGAALRQLDNIKVYVKAHPTTPIKRIEDFLKDINFPIYEWATGTVQEWLVQVHAVIMTGGSVSNLETMAMGVPLIRVSLENNFNFDCLWDEYPFAPFTSSAKEIHNYLEKAMQMNSEERERLIEFGKEMVRNYFEQVTPENLKVFL
jgi:hypothetical protein